MRNRIRHVMICFFLAAAAFVSAAASTPAPLPDLVIKKADVTAKVRFYPYKLGATTMEVLALRAPDGTVRTAFNTCQVCYSSGRGYYVQDGDVLVCQNCGNRFKAAQVELIKGGCNPVPITRDLKTETADVITIPGSLMQQAAFLFSNWKKR